MSHQFNPAYSQLVPLNQYQPQYGRFGNFMPYAQPYDHNVNIRRHQQTNSRPMQNSRKSNPKPFRQQQPQPQTKTPNAYSKIVKSSKAFCETEECSPAAKQIIALLTSLLEATSNNQQSHSTESIDEHRRQHSIVIANLPESANGSAQARIREDTKHVKDILDQLEIEAAPITVYRMGKRGETSSRLLKVEMPPKQHTRRILQTKANLSNSQAYSQVRIRASLTPEDRSKRAELVKKCNELRANDPEKQHDFVIWRGTVIRRAEIQDKLDEEKEKANNT